MARPRVAEDKKYIALSFRLDPDTLTFIDAYTAHLNRRFVGLQADKSTAARMLLQLGIEAVKAGHDPAVPGGQLVTGLEMDHETDQDSAAATAKRKKSGTAQKQGVHA